MAPRVATGGGEAADGGDTGAGTARDAVIGLVRAALCDRPHPVPVPRGYRRGSATAQDERGALLDLLSGRLSDYRASVRRVAPGAVAATIALALRERGARSVVTPQGLPAGWLSDWPTEVTRLPDEPPLDHRTLDRADGVVTTCVAAVAETGTLILDGGPGQGRRVLTLLPDYHLVVVPSGVIVAGVPEAIARISPHRPLTWISGPSATSDIELTRVEGVHGPRSLEVLLVG